MYLVFQEEIKIFQVEDQISFKKIDFFFLYPSIEVIIDALEKTFKNIKASYEER